VLGTSHGLVTGPFTVQRPPEYLRVLCGARNIFSFGKSRRLCASVASIWSVPGLYPIHQMKTTHTTAESSIGQFVSSFHHQACPPFGRLLARQNHNLKVLAVDDQFSSVSDGKPMTTCLPRHLRAENRGQMVGHALYDEMKKRQLANGDSGVVRGSI